MFVFFSHFAVMFKDAIANNLLMHDGRTLTFLKLYRIIGYYRGCVERRTFLTRSHLQLVEYNSFVVCFKLQTMTLN